METITLDRAIFDAYVAEKLRYMRALRRIADAREGMSAQQMVDEANAALALADDTEQMKADLYAALGEMEAKL